MKLKNQLPKKFFKKNLLLQKDLEGFLNWRQNQEKNSGPISFKINSYSFNSFKDPKKKTYKPLQFTFFKVLWPNEFFFLNFFSGKKPFMTLWFFPLFAITFLSLIKSDEKSSAQLNNVQKPTILGENLLRNGDYFSLFSSNNLKKYSANQYSLEKSRLNTCEGTYSSKNLKLQLKQNKNASANYLRPMKDESSQQSSAIRSEHPLGLRDEIEQMCSFYLRHTTDKLNPFFENVLESQNSRNFFVHKLWFQPGRLHQSNFSWIWYSLKIDHQRMIYNSFFENDTAFAQKLRTTDWILEPKKNVNSFQLGSSEIFNRPNLDYFQASIFLDNWIKRFSFLSASEMFNQTEMSDLMLKEFDNQRKMTKFTQLISHVFSLFELIQKNQSALKKINLRLNSKMYSFDHSKTDFVTTFKANFSEKYKIDCLKLWFKYYLQNQNFKIKNNFKTPATNENRSYYLRKNRTKTQLSIYKLFKNNLFLNDFQNSKQTMIWAPNIRAEIGLWESAIQKRLVSRLKKTKLLKIRKAKPFLHSDSELTNQKLYSKTYELMLLKNWNLILTTISKAELINSNTLVATKEQKTNLHQLLYELNSYRKFSKLSARILDLQREFRNNSDPKFEKNSFIFSYRNPILQGFSQSKAYQKIQNKDFENGKKRLISKPQFHLKQTLFSNNNSCTLTPVCDTTFNKDLNFKNNANLLRFCQQSLKQFVSFSKLLEKKLVKEALGLALNRTTSPPKDSPELALATLESDFAHAKESLNTNLLNVNQKKNFISKSFKLKHQKIIVLSSLKGSKARLVNVNNKLSKRKQMKQKVNLQIDFSNLSAESRKIEKIFRTYNSIKFSQSENLSKFLQVLDTVSKDTYSKNPQEVGPLQEFAPRSYSWGYGRKVERKRNKKQAYEFSRFQHILRSLKQKVRNKRAFDKKQLQTVTYKSLATPSEHSSEVRSRTASLAKLADYVGPARAGELPSEVRLASLLSERAQEHPSNILKKTSRSISPTHLQIIPNLLKAKAQNPIFIERKDASSSANKNQKLILSSSKLSKKLTYLIFLKKADFLNNSFNSVRFENQKRLEKKRRLKKLKLENRRRKKRKRFYPRPLQYRFQLYTSFINNRYNSPQSLNSVTKHYNSFSKSKISTKTSMRNHSFSTKIYRLNKKRWGNVLNRVSEKASFQRIVLALNQQTYHQPEFYKISNDILADFEKLCWKSYWLRSNIKPYIHRVQNNLKQIQVFERLKSDEISFKLLFEQSTKAIAHVSRAQREALPSLSLLSELAQARGLRRFVQENSFFQNRLGKQIRICKISLYPNTKATLQSGLNNCDNSNFFKILEKKTEYDKFVSNRICDQIKNVKSQLNVNGENQARSYKTGRQKFEIGSSVNPFSTISSFGKNIFEPTINNLPFFSLSNDNLIKPFGDMPTLRILWACHQTNLLTYNNTNFSKNLWSTYKHREQLKSNKTRKILLKIFNLYGNWHFSTGFHKNLNTLTETKSHLMSRKIQTLLGPINSENYPSYKAKIRRIQFKFKKQFNERVHTFEKNSLFQKIDLEQRSERPSLWFETPLQTKLQKAMPHFWWSTKQKNPIETPFPIFFSTPSSFLNLNSYFFARPNFNMEPSQRFRISKFNDFDFNQTLIFTTFWFSCLFFHLSLFFVLIRIPEIRDLLKFQFLILSKLGNTYLNASFEIYRVLSIYKNKLNHFVQDSLFSFKQLKKSDYETNLRSRTSSNPNEVRSDPEPDSSLAKLGVELNFNKKIFNPSIKSSHFKLSSSILSLIIKRLIIDKKRRLKIEKSVDLNLVTSFRCRLFFQFIQIHLVESKKQKLEPFITLDKQNSFLFFISRDSFYQELTKLSFIGSFIEKKSSIKIKNHIYDFFSGWQWYVDHKNSLPVLGERKTESLKRVKQHSEEWIVHFLRHKKDILSFNPRNSIRSATTKIDFSFVKNSKIQFQSLLALLILSVTKVFVQMFYFSFVIFYKLLFSIVDCMESFLLVFYKFFEKPAELMVTWIADFFLVEWSSDLINYVPDSFDRDIWVSLFKFSRSSRGIFPVPLSFFVQRMLLISNEICYRWLLKPDSDLITRQKKGIVFWDIWSEILILAAEQYKMNLSSLSTLKEEQELLIENLIRDKIILEPNIENSKAMPKSLKTLFSDPDRRSPRASLGSEESFTQKSYSETSKKFQLKRTTNVRQTGFFASSNWTESFEKLEPLLTFLKTQPSNPSSWSLNQVSSKQRKEFGIRLFRQFQTVDLSILDSQLPIKPSLFYNVLDQENGARPSEVMFDFMKSESYERWSVNQTLTTQGRDTDLFMDIHPPKSFLHVGFLKNYLAPQEILGSLVCDIYSGQFAMKISKNILIVGPPGRTKSFFVQALAGETESKIVIDNAHRYTFMNGGVPIGMKLLREVFDSIALHTPCLFLLEDIHVIGERRPMLISDDEISKSKTDTFGAEQEEVHEKDRSVYQLSRHALSHYNRPYKGDFSLSIPTNHFCYDLFLGASVTRKRLSNLSAQSPLPVKTIEQNLMGQQKTEEGSFSKDSVIETFGRSNSFVSFLQLSIDQVFAPPVTSPFNILLLKEQKKLKVKKIVKELPWSGLSHDQSMLISKTSYSIRSKVAMLAELSMTNLSMKLDMITDLLVIIDSVRSNRGFVVFATTHLPALLDPALRRPGRLDETISLPVLPNLMSRFEIFKLRTSFKYEPFDFFDYSLLSPLTNENQIESFISKGMLLLLNTKGKMYNGSRSIFYSNFVKDYSIYSLSQALRSIFFPNLAFINAFHSLKFLKLNMINISSKQSRKTGVEVLTSRRSVGSEVRLEARGQDQTLSVAHSLSEHTSALFSSNDKLPYLPLTYSKAGRFLIEAILLQNHSIYSTQFFHSSTISERFEFEGSDFKMLYSFNYETSNMFVKLFAGKISEFFVFNESPTSSKKHTHKILNKTPLLNPSQGGLFDTFNDSDTYWKSALNFLDSFFQKRYLYNKNLIASKLLFLEDQTTLRQAPSPPNSSILMPAKKFENYKRTLRDFTQKPMFTINEKIQSHQQQRFLKLLYNVPLQKSFRTSSNSNSIAKCHSNENFSNFETTHFYSSFKELGYLDLITLKPSSSSSFYKNQFVIRHRFSFLNQWWNGQLAEHNIESTYLSHVDWRSMFVPSIGDLIIDFPDAEQYYNPRSRRWFLHSTSLSYWFDFEQQYRTAIYQHYIYQAFMKTSEFLNQNRELLDYLAFRFLRQHQLKEIDLISVLVRFEKQAFKVKD